MINPGMRFVVDDKCICIFINELKGSEALEIIDLFKLIGDIENTEGINYLMECCRKYPNNPVTFGYCG